MSCQARKLGNYEEFVKLPSIKYAVGFGILDEMCFIRGVNIDANTHNDVKLNLKLVEKYFEVEALDETLAHRRNEYQTRREYLQKRQDALRGKEIMFKERILR